MNKINTKRLVESAIMIAVATILSMFKIVNYPFGGGITLFAMLPIILISYRYGVKWGMFSSLVFALLQLMLAFTGAPIPMPSVMTWVMMMFLDYVLAYFVLGIGGMFRNRIKSPTVALVMGVIVAVAARYFVHFISGMLFFGSYASWFFGADSGFSMGVGQFFLDNFTGNGLSVIYSAVYNGVLMAGELAITIVGAVLVSRIPILSGKVNVKTAA